MKTIAASYWVENSDFAALVTDVTKSYKSSSDRVFLRGLNAVNQRSGEVLINALLIYTVDPADDKSVAVALELGKKETLPILEHFRKHMTGLGESRVERLSILPVYSGV
jgi:hypothetical protein